MNRRTEAQNKLWKIAYGKDDEKASRKLFCCSICDKEFVRKDDLKKHESNHGSEKNNGMSQGSDKPFSCSQCDKKLTTSDELKTHERNHTCPDYLESKCIYGGKGENERGVCAYAHPRKCIYFQTNSCRRGSSCQFLHIKSSRQVNNHFNARNATRNSSQNGNRGFGMPSMNELASFLDQRFSEIKERIGKLEQDSNNNFNKSQDQNNNRGQWQRRWS